MAVWGAERAATEEARAGQRRDFYTTKKTEMTETMVTRGGSWKGR